jgi:bifunctional UDP-N-acetylglucosamine pyrophosphorylase/glucosamine-1-phosphate N-acetyltransferase
MTARSAAGPAVVLVDDVAGGAAPLLCHRPAVDWLLDTVEALSPATLTVVAAADGPPAVADAQTVCDRIARRPHLSRLLRASGSGAPVSATLVLPCSLPLLRPATLRSPGAREAVVLASVRHRQWWEERTSAAGPIAILVAGTVDDVSALAAPTTAGGRDPARSARRRLAATGARVRTSRIDGVEALCVNDPVDRARAETALYARIAAGWLERGVEIEDPATTRIDATVRIGAGARIRPHTELVGDTAIGSGSVIGPLTTVRDSRVGERSQVHYSVCQDVEIGEGTNVGPFTWLRSGTRLGARCRAGAFVELADSVVGEGTSVPHLAGLFSADVGRDCNFGSMSGPANFDGVRKHRTRIGDSVSIGSGSILVAPVSIGNRAHTAAGTIISEDVPDGALAIARTPQRNVTGWATRKGDGRPVPHGAATASPDVTQ